MTTIPFPPIAELATCAACDRRATRAILVPYTDRTGESGEAWEGTCARCYPSDESWQSAPLDLVRQAAELEALPAPVTRYGILAEPKAQDITIDDSPPTCTCWHPAPETPQARDTCGWCTPSAPRFVLTAPCCVDCGERSDIPGGVCSACEQADLVICSVLAELAGSTR